MMRGVIQVRCQRPWRRPAQAAITPFEIAVERHRVVTLAHLPAQIVWRCGSLLKNSTERCGGDHHFSGAICASG